MSNSTDGTAVFGLTFSTDNLAAGLLEYVAVNIVASSVIPIPVAGALVAVGVMLFGVWVGMVVNVLSATLGSYISLLLTRSCCRSYFQRLLGRHGDKWQALDHALVSDGPTLALLLRLTPLAPFVVTNILLSLTSISHFTYVWTTLIGIIPGNLPYAYAAQLGVSLAQDFPPKDPVMLSTSILGLVASVLLAWRVGVIANRALRKHGLADSSVDPDAPMRPCAESGGASALRTSSDCASPAATSAMSIDGDSPQPLSPLAGPRGADEPPHADLPPSAIELSDVRRHGGAAAALRSLCASTSSDDRPFQSLP